MHPNLNVSNLTEKSSAAKNAVARKIKPSITKNAVINAFNGLHFNQIQWQTYLADPPKWLKVCRVEKGDDKIPATWNPVLIGQALLMKGVPMNKLDEVFVNLENWSKKWNAATN